MRVLWLAAVVLLGRLAVTNACFGPFAPAPQPDAPDGVLWAVLVCGSNGWENYRHQADVAAMYQVLHTHGVPDERIITMLYDDVAWHTDNPWPGKLYHYYEQTGHLSWNMYEGMPRDYTKQDVSKENLARLLLGMDMTGIGSGKTLNSGATDRILLYYSDHGLPGLLQMIDKALYVDEMEKLITTMHEHNRYKQMVIYLEACESGSMFAGLRDDIGVYAVTATDGKQNSLASFCQVADVHCMSDTFTYILTQNALRQRSLMHETLTEQFLLVRAHLLDSPAQRYGDIEGMGALPVGRFFGDATADRYIDKPIYLGPVLKEADSRDEPLYSLKKDIDQAFDDERRHTRLQKQLRTLNAARRYADTLVERLVLAALRQHSGAVNATMAAEALHTIQHTKQNAVADLTCYKRLWNTFNEMCLPFEQHAYVMRYGHVFNNMCDSRLMQRVTLTQQQPRQQQLNYDGLLHNHCSIMVHKPRRTL